MTAREELTHLVGRLGDDERKLVQLLAEDLASDASGARSDLFAVVHELADRQVQQLLGVARVMALPIEEAIDPASTVVTPNFAAEFRGRATAVAPSRTTRFFDASVDGEQTALKTEGAKSMKADRLHISKLSEAAWIQDMRSGRTRREKTMDEFLAAVARIFVLRYYQADTAPHYELVEIPTAHRRSDVSHRSHHPARPLA